MCKLWISEYWVKVDLLLNPSLALSRVHQIVRQMLNSSRQLVTWPIMHETRLRLWVRKKERKEKVQFTTFSALITLHYSTRTPHFRCQPPALFSPIFSFFFWIIFYSYFLPQTSVMVLRAKCRMNECILPTPQVSIKKCVKNAQRG